MSSASDSVVETKEETVDLGEKETVDLGEKRQASAQDDQDSSDRITTTQGTARDKDDSFEFLPSTVANRVMLGDCRLQFLSKIRFKPDDDTLTRLSKTVSYILRHGPQDAGVEMDQNRCVEVLDLLAITEQTCDIGDYDKLVKLLKESNTQKQRYSFQETETGKLLIKATKKETLPGTSIKASAVKDTKWAGNNKWREQKQREKDGDKENDAHLANDGDWSQWEKQLKPPSKPTGNEARKFRVLHSEYFQKVIIREHAGIDSKQIGSLIPGDIVTQIGEHLSIDNDTIVRIHIRDEEGVEGWVTKDARKAEGPLFLEEIVRTPKEPSESDQPPAKWSQGAGDWNDWSKGRDYASKPSDRYRSKDWNDWHGGDRYNGWGERRSSGNGWGGDWDSERRSRRGYNDSYRGGYERESRSRDYRDDRRGGDQHRGGSNRGGQGRRDRNDWGRSRRNDWRE